MTSRLKTLQQSFDRFSIDSFFISNPKNIRYLTGCEGLSPWEREALLFITKTTIHLFTDGRYEGAFAHNVQNTNKKIHLHILSTDKNLFAYIHEITQKAKIKRIGFESEDLKWSEYEAMRTSVQASLKGIKNFVGAYRLIKEKEEQIHIQHACRIADMCMKEVKKYLYKNRTEKEISWFISSWVHEKGLETAFDPIVACNASTSIPHYATIAGNGTMSDRSILLIDLGIRYNGYCSDITRMFFKGTIPDEVKNMYEKLRMIQQETIEQLSIKNSYSEVDLFCRNRIHTDMGIKYGYPHSTGHGIGLEVHEHPKVSSLSTETIEEGQVITIEPGIYIPGKWGMRIEDTVLIRKHKGIKVLTSYPKKMEFL